MESKPLQQTRWHLFVVGQAFIERHHAEPAGAAHAHAVALDDDFLQVEHGGDAGGRRCAQALGHREQHDAAVGLGQQAALRHRPARLQGGGQVEPAQQPVVVDVQRHAPVRCAGGQQRGE